MATAVYNTLIECHPGAVSGAPGSTVYRQPLPFKDSEDQGAYFIAGTVTINEGPAARKVRLHTLNNGRLIREMWSDPVTGAYRFNNLKDQPYYIWSEDYARIYDPVSRLVTNSAG